MYTRPQRLVAEFIGTFVLVFIGTGSICADQFLKAANAGSVGLLGIAVAHGLAMGIMVTAVGYISGGHFNPAITAGFWVTKKMSTLDSFLYWVFQLLGAIAAAYLLRWMVPEAVWRAVALGTPDLTADLTRARGIVLEGVLTFFLVFVVFATAADPRGAFNKIAGFAIGLTITMDILLGGPLTGASMNPARTLGPALASHHWLNHGVYWVGPLAGGILAGWAYDSLFLRQSRVA